MCLNRGGLDGGFVGIEVPNMLVDEWLGVILGDICVDGCEVCIGVVEVW